MLLILLLYSPFLLRKWPLSDRFAVGADSEAVAFGFLHNPEADGEIDSFQDDEGGKSVIGHSDGNGIEQRQYLAAIAVNSAGRAADGFRCRNKPPPLCYCNKDIYFL